MKKSKKIVKTHAQFVKWLEDKIVTYRHQMSLNHWQITVWQKQSNDNIFTFQVHFASDRGYQKAEIEWAKEAFDMFQSGESGDIEQLERSLIHELSHVLLRRLSEIASKRHCSEHEYGNAEESVCDHIAFMIHRILNGWKAK